MTDRDNATLTVEPADLLGRYLIGETVTRAQLYADTSPWVCYWLPNYHGRRLHWMLNHDNLARGDHDD